MSDPLDRFIEAQNEPHAGYADALAEIRGGRKRSHWIWYIFPQPKGLGTSPMSEFYGIASRDEAVAYINHPVLSARLFEITAAAAAHVQRGVPLRMLMGSELDAMKLTSCLTLFRDLDADFAQVADPILSSVTK